MSDKAAGGAARGCTLFLVTLLAALAVGEETARSEKVIKEKPIVIETQVQHYDQPTLGEYQACHENLDKCLNVCRTARDPKACEAQCPTCPILVNQEVLVQGVNDTDYRAPSAPAGGNTTNVIRLTNEIRNIIDNNMGNITANNLNNIHIHQNVSATGGKFGLGYNQQGSCCIVLHPTRRCSRPAHSSAVRCHRKRYRVCGERCEARVMEARRSTECSDFEGTQCRPVVTYRPYRRRRRTTAAQPSCHYTQHWPFVACPRAHRRGAGGEICQRCYELPYIRILQQRIPSQCMACPGLGLGSGMGVGVGVYPGMGPGFYGAAWPPCYLTNSCYRPPPVPELPYYPPPMYRPRPRPPLGSGDDDEFLLEGDGWTVERTRCRRPDGTLTTNCPGAGDQDWGSGDDQTERPPAGGDPLEHLPDPEDEVGDYDDTFGEDDDIYGDGDDYDLGGVEAERHRRHSMHGFRRSKYSRRYRDHYGDN